ncbi:MAG TPA: hypothetical protein VH575_31385 [Gemmataceae bacterium]|jgi:hypothetical protein
MTDVSRLVSPEEFAAAMTRRWHSLGNISSSKLQQLWASMASTFARAIADNHAGGNKCRVLEPPTGTGKTQGLCVYAALSVGKNRASSAPLGILVVTRTIAQADDIVATIKELVSDPADADRVRASHSEAKQTLLAMRAADVLVITHEAYTRALEGLYKEQFGRWEDYTTWAHGTRRLTIIDEALSGAVEENQVKADDIRFALGFIGPPLRGQFPKQVEALKRACDVLDQIAAFNADSKEEAAARIISKGGRNSRIFPGPCSMGPLRKAMKGIRYDLIASSKDSPADRRRIADKVDRTLKDCEAIMARWAYYYRKGKDHTFNSSQLLIPPDLPGPVILDATASQNFLWKLLGSRAEVAPVPDGTRNYANVTIHVARSSGLGKSKMTEKAKVRIPRLLTNLGRHLTADRKVLLCVHKKIKHMALSYDPGFAAYSVANWGAIDGKNDWNDHDAVVIFGLPYRDPIWATNTFFALQGLQDDRWLEQPSWGAYADVRREMQRRQLTVSIIQAVNRVRCRRVIDADGNCPPTDVFLVLPNGADGEAILGHILEEMPGATLVPWEFEMDGPSERVRRGSSHEPLLALMTERLPGETPMSFVKSELGLTPSGVKDLQGVLRDDNHALTKALGDLGVRYMTSGKGRGARSSLLKQ